MKDFERPRPLAVDEEDGEDTPEVKEVPPGKRFYRIDKQGNIEFIDNPYKVPERDPNAEK